MRAKWDSDPMLQTPSCHMLTQPVPHPTIHHPPTYLPPFHLLRVLGPIHPTACCPSGPGPGSLGGRSTSSTAHSPSSVALPMALWRLDAREGRSGQVGRGRHPTLALGPKEGSLRARSTEGAQKCLRPELGPHCPLVGDLVPGAPQWPCGCLCAVSLSLASARSPQQKLHRCPDTSAAPPVVWGILGLGRGWEP